MGIEKMKIDSVDENDEISMRELYKEKMKEEVLRIDSLPDRDVIDEANHMLGHLGLNLDDLKNKKVVDLGSGPQIIERASTITGAGTVFSVEGRKHRLTQDPRFKNGIFADIRKGIPQIADNSIDLLISHAGPPTIPAISRVKEDVDFSIKEILRMLKDGGEARMGTTFYFIEEKYPRYWELGRKKEKDLLDAEKEEKEKLESLIKEESLNYLKEKGLNVVSAQDKSADQYLIILK
jgi:hypothetical protein